MSNGQNSPNNSAAITKKNIFVHHDAHPLILDLLLIREFGAEWLGWEANTLWSEIQRVFEQPPLPVLSKNKIQATRTLHLTEAPWMDWETFCVVCAPLNNNIPNFEMLHKPTPAQIMAAVNMMNAIIAREWSEEVSKFIAACYLDDSIYYLPPPIDFAQDEAAMLRYRCKKCGNIDRDDENDWCDLCRADKSYLVKEPKFDVASVQRRYNEIMRQGEDRDTLQETVEDVQVAKLLVAKDYCAMRDQQLRHQARLWDET